MMQSIEEEDFGILGPLTQTVGLPKAFTDLLHYHPDFNSAHSIAKRQAGE